MFSFYSNSRLFPPFPLWLLMTLTLILPLNAQKEESRLMENKTFWRWNVSSASYSIHYVEKGSGPQHVLLIHGFAAHSYTWKFLIDELAEAGYHVWALDLLGFGYSDKPPKAQYGLDLFIAQIEAFMGEMGIRSASLVGHSMGGGLSLATSILHGDRVQSLVLIDALAYPIKLPIYFFLTKVLGNLSRPFFGKGMTKRILKDLMHDPKKISQEQIEAYSLPYDMPGGKYALIRTLQNFRPEELDQLAPHFKNIKVPILLIWGEQDKWMPQSYYQQLSKALPHAQHALIANCGHIPQEEYPQTTLKAILKFYNHIHAKDNGSKIN